MNGMFILVPSFSAFNAWAFGSFIVWPVTNLHRILTMSQPMAGSQRKWEIKSWGLRIPFKSTLSMVWELPTMVYLLQFLLLPNSTFINKHLTPKPYVKPSNAHFSQSLFIIIQNSKLTSKINSLQIFQKCGTGNGTKLLAIVIQVWGLGARSSESRLTPEGLEGLPIITD